MGRIVCLPWESLDQTEHGWLYVLVAPGQDPVEGKFILKVTWHGPLR